MKPDPSKTRIQQAFAAAGRAVVGALLATSSAEATERVFTYTYEPEPKIIIGQRHGDWKWAANFIYENEWEHNLRDVVGIVEGTAGLSLALRNNWSVGLEARNRNKWLNYSGFSSSAVFVGPAIRYRKERFWGTLTVMPQVWGHNYGGDPDGETGLDLVDNGRLLIRLILAFDL